MRVCINKESISDPLLEAIVVSLEDIKATNIVYLKVSQVTAMFDQIVIATVESGRQSRAAVQKIQELIKPYGNMKIFGVEGLETGEWVLIDMGDIVLHIMQPKTREFYNLEELWNIY